MTTLRQKTPAFALILALATATPLQAEEHPAFRLAGSFKNLLSASRTPARDERYWSDLSRLKLDLEADLSRVVRFRAVLDNEFLVGSLLETDDFQDAKELESNTRWDLDTLVTDNDDLVWRANVYRAYLKLAFDRANVVAGRQRVAWGTGRIWNPTDLFNPISPLQIERSQRDGIDGVSAEYFFGRLSSVTAVYALGADDDQNSAAVRAGTNLRGYDVGIMAGEFRRDRVIGFDFGGNLGEAGLRGEATWTDPRDGDDFVRAVVSWDYSWPNSVYLLLEYLYNGGNFRDSDVPDEILRARERFFQGEIVTRNRNFLAVGLGYELTPLIRADGLAIADLDESSLFVGPTLTWNLLTNLDWVVGAQWFTGDADSEYGDNANLYYTSLKLYF